MRHVTGAVVVLALLAACAGTDTGTGTGTPESGWVEHSPMGVARSEHPAVLFEGELVVVGGLVESGLGRTAVTDTVEAYDPVSDRWRSMADLPAPRHHGMATVVSGRLYVIGGFSEGGFDAVDSVWELVEGSWAERAPLPRPVGAGSSVALDDLVYVVGGVPDGGLFSYDPKADIWAELSGPSSFREHLAAVALDGEIWALGGRGPGEIHATTEIYDPVSDSWRSGPSLNAARSGFGAAVTGGSIYVAGGEVFNPNRALDSTERLDPGMGEWQLAEVLPVGLHGNPLVAIDGILYLPGGSTRPAGVDNAGELFSLQTG